MYATYRFNRLLLSVLFSFFVYIPIFVLFLRTFDYFLSFLSLFIFLLLFVVHLFRSNIADPMDGWKDVWAGSFVNCVDWDIPKGTQSIGP